DGDNPVCRNHRIDGRRETGLEGGHAAVGKGRRSEDVDNRIELVVGADREIVAVGIVREWRVADSEPGSDDRLLVEAIGKAESWREILVAGFHAHVEGMSPTPAISSVLFAGL